ncbi:MAG: hypothetical protein JXQ27_13140 [Acidobacteria bacterium]|nr:hypothetical protein [Acidobacteriota bacterium]
MGRLDNWMLDYAENGIALDFLGVTSLDGPPLYRVRRTYPDGFEEDLLFSASTSMLAEIYSDYTAVLPFMKSYFSLWDYRTVGGIKLPHVFIRNVGPLGPPHGGVLVDVKVNVPLADSLFVPPDRE